MEKMWRLYPTGAPDWSHSLSFVLSLGRDMLTEADSVFPRIYGGQVGLWWEKSVLAEFFN